MFLIPSAVRIYICREPTDMRRSFDGLAGMVRDFLGQNPLSGHVFVFRSRRGDRVKLLFFDRSGLCLWYKRLEEGTFTFPQSEERSIEVDAAELGLLLEGIDLAGATRQRRFRLPASEPHLPYEHFREVADQIEGGSVDRCNDDPKTTPADTRLNDEETLARMSEIQEQMAALRRKEEIILEILARRDPELAAELSKQKMR